MKVDLDWPTPDYLDLEVYRKKADGSLTLVGSSDNLPGEKESVLVNAPTPGHLRAAGDQLRRRSTRPTSSPCRA